MPRIRAEDREPAGNHPFLGSTSPCDGGLYRSYFYALLTIITCTSIRVKWLIPPELCVHVFKRETALYTTFFENPAFLIQGLLRLGILMRCGSDCV